MGKTKVQKIGFLVGIVAMLVIGFMPTPEGLSLVGQRVLAVTVLMVVFWITEAMPIPFTALLPIFLFPVMQITGSKGQNDITLFAHYAYSTCYLLVGVGFLSGAMVKRPAQAYCSGHRQQGRQEAHHSDPGIHHCRRLCVHVDVQHDRHCHDAACSSGYFQHLGR